MKFLKHLIIIITFFHQSYALNNHATLELIAFTVDHDSDPNFKSKLQKEQLEQKIKNIQKLQAPLLSAEIQKRSNSNNDTRNRLREMQLQQNLRSMQKHPVVNKQSNSNVQPLPASEIRRLRKNTVDDWKKIYETKAAANGFFTPIDQWPEKQRVILFENFHYYEIPSYREMLATFPEYGQIMGELSQKIRNENLAFNTNITDIRVNGEYIGNFISKEADKYHAGQRAIHYQEQKLEFENAKSGIIEQYKQEFNKRQINVHEEVVITFNAQELLQEYEDQLKSGQNQDTELRNILTERVNALKEEIANNGEITQKNYQLSNVAQEFMQSKALNFVAFESCVGTAFQQQIHKEFIQITDQAADIASKHHGIKEIQDISETVTLFALKGCTENKAGKQTLATALADAGHCILAFTKGVIKGADGSMERVRQLLLWPEKEFPKLMKATLKTAHILLLVMYESPGYYPESSFLGEEPSERYIELGRQLMPFLNPLTTGDVMAEHVGHMCGSLAMDMLLGEFVVSPILATSKETLSLANASASNHLKKLGAIGNESAKIIGLANQKGSSKVIQAIDVIAEYPHIAAAEQSLVKRVGQAAEHIEYYHEYINEISQSVKLAASDLNYKKIFDNYKLPYSFIPPKEGFITRQYENILRTVDKFGNEWTYHLPQLTTPDGWKVNLSEIGQKQIGWLNKEGMVSKLSSQQLGQKIKPIGTYLTPHVGDYFLVLDKEIDILKKSFDFKKTFNNKPLKLNYKHFLDLDVETIVKGSNIKYNLTGFHHDYKGILEKSGFIKLKNKVNSINNCYKAQILWNDKQIPKTFFPKEWPRKKIVEKIIEAFDNLIEEPLHKPNGSWILTGKTNDGLIIEIAINSKGNNIMSAYPSMENFNLK